MSSVVDIEAVRQEYLRRMTQGNGDLLQQVEQYVVAHEGKMLRPQLTLLAAATLGDAVLNSRRTLLMATCVEMLHNASLLHDDVIDHADSRRGRPSVNAQWDSTVAVLVGDYHLAQIMQLLDEANDADASRMVNKTVIAMVEAELLAKETADLSKERYLRIIDGKTARLFATACALGNPEYEDFGLHYGRLFQLRDDIADGETTQWTDILIKEEENILAAIKHQLPIHNNKQ